ncbi:odorant receptor 131-2-like [Emydura macquarii macquarii]|uniref:odorant receptor 131-2-like n=1 Tax=Emydura macquarii macquarii TaxID=1129001 RepID=UPI00352A3E29
MNSSNNSLNDTTKGKEIEIVQASLYLVDFIFITAIGLLIFKTVRQNSEMKKKVQYFLLCHHLLCCSLFCCFGVTYNTIRALGVKSPQIVFWIIFGVQVAIGEGVLITLTLMALNRCFAVCWPFRYLSLVHSVKHKVMIGVWMITMIKSMCLLIEGIGKSPEDIFEVVPSCSIVLGGLFARTTGITLILFLLTIIIISYCLLYREGKRAGHFNSSNSKARKTIIIHGLQMSFLLFPPLIIIAGKRDHYFILNLTAFVVFSLAQCFSPVVYGLRNKELQIKLFNRQKTSLCTHYMKNDSDIEQSERPEQLNDSELTDTRCCTPGPYFSKRTFDPSV